MTTEQRRALADTIPTTEVIKDAVTYPRERLGEPLDISPERFEAWLTRVRRDAAREALAGLEAEVRAKSSEYRQRYLDGITLWVDELATWTARYRDTHYPETEDQT